MGSTSAGAEQYYAEGSPKEHMNRREVGFIGLASEPCGTVVWGGFAKGAAETKRGWVHGVGGPGCGTVLWAGIARGADAPKRGWVHGVGGRAGAERYYGEGLPEEQLHRRGVGFMGSAGARVRNGFL